MTNPSRRPPTIFVVDDDARMRTALSLLFQAADLAVKTYASGQELLDTCDFAGPGLLLLDMSMPAMSGLELQAILLQRRVGLPIIFLTGSGTVPVAVEAMRRGAVDFLEKPIASALLVERVRLGLSSAADKAGTSVTRTEYERRDTSLTRREREVMLHVVTGQTNKMMARVLGVSHRTIEIHRTRVMSKMRAASLVDLVEMALAHAGRN